LSWGALARWRGALSLWLAPSSLSASKHLVAGKNGCRHRRGYAALKLRRDVWQSPTQRWGHPTAECARESWSKASGSAHVMATASGDTVVHFLPFLIDELPEYHVRQALQLNCSRFPGGIRIAQPVFEQALQSALKSPARTKSTGNCFCLRSRFPNRL
jgi:hypothetical protein